MSGERRSREERRQELLPRLYRVLSQHGLGAANLRLLGRETGASARMLHYYFGSAEALLHAVVQYERQQQLEQLATLVGDDAEEQGGSDAADPVDRASALIMHYFDLVTEPARRGFMILFFEVHGRAAREPERFGAFLEHATTDWVIYMQQAAAGITGTHVSRGAVAAVLALVRGAYLALLSGSPREEVRAWVAPAVGTLIRQAFTGGRLDGDDEV